MIFQLQELDRAGFELLPEDCQVCGWWQGHDDGWPGSHQADSWAETAIERFGGWGKLAVGDGELLGMIQYGPSVLFGRSGDLACGPVSNDAVLLTCSFAHQDFQPVRKSLLTAVLAEMKERQVETVEAFCFEDVPPENECRLFSQDFLQDCGFYPVRSSRGLLLMRFELGGVLPTKAAKQKTRRRLLERIKRTAPAPAPVALCRSAAERGPAERGPAEACADLVTVCP
ncbi:MAG: hypothetical protein M1539_05440 [Actinobacteria bacterium]|nr:hypothetical protein [Actinomycetota bacterium]